jgi:hypothetical protein
MTPHPNNPPSLFKIIFLATAPQLTNYKFPRAALGEHSSPTKDKKMSDTDSPVTDASTLDALAALLEQAKESGKLTGLLESAAHPQAASGPAGALARDILYGAGEIAEFLYGERKFRRKIYNLIASDRLPHFRLGTSICGRKSMLVNWIAKQENSLPFRDRGGSIY